MYMRLLRDLKAILSNLPQLTVRLVERLIWNPRGRGHLMMGEIIVCKIPSHYRNAVIIFETFGFFCFRATFLASFVIEVSF
jgi:hypothetical protein